MRHSPRKPSVWHNTTTSISAPGLRSPRLTPDRHKRGESVDVYAIPGLWIELDHCGGVHTAVNLPTSEQLLQFIADLPFQFSLLIDSTGGIHAYLLFREAWIFETPEEREQAARLLRRFQRTIKVCATEHGWTVDITADLARILRPAGTFNHKSGIPKLVTILQENAIRYNPSDILDASWLLDIQDTWSGPRDDGDFPPTDLETIVSGCAWLRHCRDDAKGLPESEWYAMLGIVGRCEGGDQLAHEWSRPYPGYTAEETTKKLHHALRDAGPRTCETIRFDLGGEPYCCGCPSWKQIISPIAIGTDDGAQLIITRENVNGSAPNNTSDVNLAKALLTFPEMLALDIPERKRWNPWLPERGLVMIYGPRGIGKTQVGLGLAIALTTGSPFLTWKTLEPVGGLYIDGEMPLDELRQRVKMLAGDQKLAHLYFLTGEAVYHELERDLILTSEPFRQAIIQILDAHPEIKVVLLDNISCLFSGISEDRKQDWEPINTWLIRLRHRGLSVVLIHHAGKAGQQRGTSGRENPLDTIISLEWPPNYEPQDGCHFQMRFTKSRSVKGDAVNPLDVRLIDIDGATTWSVTPPEESRLEQVRKLLLDGVDSVSAIAEELNITKGYASKLRKRAEEGGIAL